MREQEVESIVREYVREKYPSKDGWVIPRISSSTKRPGESGIDVPIYNQKKGDRLVIEVKKWSDNTAANHNAFYSLFGQLLSRIKNEPAPHYSRRRKMIIAATVKFVDLIHKKIHNVRSNRVKGMQGGWSLFSKIVNLRIWTIDMSDRSIQEYHWKDLLKENYKS